MPQPKKPILDLGPKSPMLLALEKARKDRLARIPALTNTKPGAARRELTGGPGGSTGGGSGGGGGGGGGAPAGASYITRLAESGLSNETALASLATGYLKNTTGTGVPTVQAVPIPATDGGTGQTSFAVGDLLYASTTSALSKLADIATGNVLLSGGVNTAPAYGKVGLTTHVSGTLPVANGGTGATTAPTALSSLFGSYTGNALKGVRVNAGETDFEYVTFPTGTVGGTGTDNRIARWDGTDDIQSSQVTISDDGVIVTGGAVETERLRTFSSGDLDFRFRLIDDGTMEWSDGSSLTGDISLSRIASSVLGLASGDSFRVGNFIEGTEVSTPANPSAGFRRLYAKSDGWYDLDSSGTETGPFGTGGGGSGLTHPQVMARAWVL